LWDGNFLTPKKNKLKIMPPMVDDVLTEDIRLLKLLGVGLCARYTTVKEESSLLTTLSAVPGSSIPASVFQLAERTASKIARIVFNIGVVQWGFDTVDKITSRELILLFTRAAENVESQQDDLDTTDQSLVRHLMAFLRDVALSNGTLEQNPEKVRRLASILSSPGSKKNEWFLKEDKLRAQLTMLSSDIDLVRKQLIKALSTSATKERLLEEAKNEMIVISSSYQKDSQALQEKLRLEQVNVVATQSALMEEQSSVNTLKIQLAAQQVKCQNLMQSLRENKQETLTITESVGTLMDQLTRKTKEVSELEAMKTEHANVQQNTKSLKDQITKSNALNITLMEELKLTEQKLIDVQSYMHSNSGSKLKTTEYALAKARVELAQCESEKDDLEQEVEDLKASLQQTLTSRKASSRSSSAMEENRNYMHQRQQKSMHNRKEQHWG